MIRGIFLILLGAWLFWKFDSYFYFLIIFIGLFLFVKNIKKEESQPKKSSIKSILSGVEVLNTIDQLYGKRDHFKTLEYCNSILNRINWDEIIIRNSYGIAIEDKLGCFFSWYYANTLEEIYNSNPAKEENAFFAFHNYNLALSRSISKPLQALVLNNRAILCGDMGHRQQLEVDLCLAYNLNNQFDFIRNFVKKMQLNPAKCSDSTVYYVLTLPYHVVNSTNFHFEFTAKFKSKGGKVVLMQNGPCLIMVKASSLEDIDNKRSYEEFHNWVIRFGASI